MMESILLGWQTVFHPVYFMMVVLGVLIGILFGVVPGLSGVTAISLLIPFTYAMEPLNGFLIMIAIYAASIYGGSIAAILFNIPGDAPAAMTALDGYPLARQGHAGRALGMAAISSLVGGSISVIAITFLAPQAAQIALSFGPPEYFALGLLGLTVVASIDANHQLKAFVSVFFGLFLATVGLDVITGVARYTFNSTILMSGIDFVPAIIGLFALSEVFMRLHKKALRQKMPGGGKEVPRFAMPTKEDVANVKNTWLRSSVIGTVIGFLPGAGATIAAFVGYGAAVSVSKDKESYGKGNIDGVAGPEAANNAAVGGAMVPLLTLGIPGGAVTAVILSAFLIHGLQPGPLLFDQNPEIVYTLFSGMFIANILMTLVVLIAIRYLVKVLDVPYEYLGMAIILLALVGSFAINNRIGDVWIMFFFGLVGYVLKRYHFSLAAVVLGVVLGQIIETGLRQGLMITQGSILGFFTRPGSGIILTLTVLALFFPLLKRLFTKREMPQD
ncbi:tripartite tricarboxylate transporter permease [Alkalihalobacillus oceani]|uniref:tripartite tricarboxylate transporter permease n=1 Tax=Halalkalibacter oceani TaxID=1653776 RepID=UPI00203A5396|nr:tripartite tricarboxylate transporter permease [Halalkalibacter oceani]MCM3760115.1 tripartite tricarboxylate transporter permease [Halalkalibacter oceani]